MGSPARLERVVRWGPRAMGPMAVDGTIVVRSIKRGGAAMRQRWTIVWSIMLVIATTVVGVGRGAKQGVARPRPNIVVVLTDDQRFDQLAAMPKVQSRLMALGLTAARAFASDPLCSPSRASLLTGRYSHGTGIYANGDGRTGGGFPDFRDRSTVATWLHDGGYRTGLFGKYLNHYERPTYVPPGWDRWVALAASNSEYFDYTMSINGHARHFGAKPADYLTDVIGRYANGFIRHSDHQRPLFLWVGMPAPHGPNTGPPRYADLFSDLRHPKHPNFDEGDVRDKPNYLRSLDRLTERQRLAVNNAWSSGARTLLAVDDVVGRLLDALRDTGRLDNTLFVFTSDNGQAMGEHRWLYKNDPHEESIRVPLIFRWDGVVRPGSTTGAIVANVDLAPTLAAVAGVRTPRLDDSVSLLPLLRGRSPPRQRLLLEHRHYGGEWDPPTYCGVRTPHWLFVHYATGEEELYNLDRDPWELRNLRHSVGYREPTTELRQRTRALCAPRPPGMPAF